MNQVAISGMVETVEPQVKSGSNYGKIRLLLTNRKLDREDLVEVLFKTDDIENIEPGSYLVVHGSLSGKENDRGYINIGIFGMGYEIISEPLSNGTANQYNKSKSGGVRKPSSQGEYEGDIPF